MTTQPTTPEGTDITNLANPYEFEFTPKQKENWENHGRPVFEAMEKDLTKKWYLRTFRPKKKYNGMKMRDDRDTSENPERYLKDSIEQFEKPRTTSLFTVSLMYVDDDLKETLDEVAVRIVAAKVKGGKLSQRAAERIVKNNKRVAKMYGAI